MALDHDLKIIVHEFRQEGNRVLAKLGAFYSGITAGCSCADDPTPVDETPEYCELSLVMDLDTGKAQIELLP